PQEETTGGGALMVAQGCMKNPDVSCIIGQHVTPLYPAGTFYCKTGYVSGSSTDVRLTVRGKACHGAYPERGTDAIVIAAQVISALQSWSSRNRSPFEPAVFTLGTIEGGTANNIVCGEVRMAGTLRTLSNEIRKEAKERLAAIAEGVAAGMGGEAEMRFIPSYGPVYNNDRYYALVEQRALGLLGPERMVRRAAPSLGVESFCFFVQETPGVYYDIGSGVSTGLHTSTFLVDEAMLLPALALQCEAVLAVLEAD
ncbi:MAG: amidohydrolase, partial [Firmicutes bacterium]|nr:amidohydrolase [Bacillota bacterium]